MKPGRGYSGLSSGWACMSDTIRVQEETKNFFRQYQHSPGCPFCIFCHEWPSCEQLQLLIDAIHSNGAFSSRMILVLDRPRSGSRHNHWELMKCGLYDIVQATDPKELVLYLHSLVERYEEIEEILASPLVKDNLAGESPVWKSFLTEVIEAAICSNASSVLLIGDSGTGKEMLSGLIHTLDKRSNKKDLVLLDCTTIVPELSGSEFFGHEKGAYTNALQSRDGAFAMANQGTLFLDEIGDLPLSLQAELLRVIQEGTYKKVGSNSWQRTSFRLISATHRNLRQRVEEDKFRQDLYFRMADIELRVPSLKDRSDDIITLANHFLKQLFRNRDVPEFDDCVQEYLVTREYPGNVRELRQLVQRIAMKHVKHKKITIGEIPVSDRMPANTIPPSNGEMYGEVAMKKAILSGASLWDLKNKTMSDAIKAALEISHGNKKKAAERLGVTLRAVQQFLKSKKTI